MRYIFILSLFVILFPISAQTDGKMTVDQSGNVSIELTGMTGKDPIWSGITLTTSKGVKARQNSVVSFNAYTYAVSYNKETKTYVTTLVAGNEFSSTTKAAILAAINSEVYQLLTGRSKDS